MICDPITRQEVTILGRFPPATHGYRFGSRVKGEFRFVRVRYGAFVVKWAAERGGGFPEGTERDIDVNDLRADDGSREIHAAYETAPLLPD